MFLHRVNNIEHNRGGNGGNLSDTSMILYIKTVTLKNDASSEIIKFQREIIFKEHS